MADTFNAKALRGHTLHTPKGSVIFNAGQTTNNIPESHRARLERDGVIPKKAAKAAAGADDDGGDDDTPKFTATHKGFGKYEITGPGLEEPLLFEGNKAAAAAKLAELEAAAGADDDGGDDDGGAPTE